LLDGGAVDAGQMLELVHSAVLHKLVGKTQSK
jgi:hypothetical protein